MPKTHLTGIHPGRDCRFGLSGQNLSLDHGDPLVTGLVSQRTIKDFGFYPQFTKYMNKLRPAPKVSPLCPREYLAVSGLHRSYIALVRLLEFRMRVRKAGHGYIPAVTLIPDASVSYQKS